ncbi:uncharacterized membrane protein YcaP (DUF421 family) [Chitinophaga sp. W2I13]|uniref:DUF421 domain-containing protein n=1 Tax=Chitinophaga sp. W2I13 TaxID=3373923 RepID=UPI003D1FAA57
MSAAANLWGQGDQLNVLQMSVRAVAMYFVTLTLIRLGGMRIFGKKSAFDTIIVIMMGAVLARVIVGASPFSGTVAAAAVMVAINRSLAWISLKSNMINRLLKGKPLLLYDAGEIKWENMNKACLSKSDLMESLRLETLKASLAEIEQAYMETNGRISFILKPE